MKTRQVLFSLLLVLSAISACKPELDFVEGSLRPGAAEAMLSSGNVSMNFPSSAGSASVDLKASGKWTAAFVNDRAGDWCSLSACEGKRGVVTVSVSVKENPDYDQRSASIVFVCGDLKRTISVTQKQKDALLLTSNRFALDASGGTISLEVKANIPFDYSVSENARSWLKYAGTKGLTTSVLTFDVAENDSLEGREGTIVINGGTGSEVVTVSQGGSDPTIIIGKGSYELSSDAQEISIDVQSNIDVRMEIPSGCDWITESPTKSMSTSTFHLAIAENGEFVDRSCGIVFRSAEWKMEQVVTISQQAAVPQIFIGSGVYEFGAEGGDLSIDVTSNFGVTVEIPDTCSWIKYVGTKAMTTRTFGFSVEANDTFVEREGRIMFHNESLGVTEAVTVHQKADEPQIIIGTGIYDIAASGGGLSVDVTSNFGVTVEIPDTCAWIKAVKTKAMTTRTFSFTVEANDSFGDREGRILFRNESLGITEPVIVRQSQNDSFILSDHLVEVLAEGGTVEVRVDHNIDYKVSIADSWISLAETKSLKTDVLQFVIDPHTWIEPREGKVVFYYGDKNEELIVRQSCEPPYVKVVAPESRTLSYEGGILEVVLEHNSYGFRSAQAYFDNEGGASFGDDFLFNGGGREYFSDSPKQSRMTVPYTRNKLRRERRGYFYIFEYSDNTKCIDTVVFVQPPAPILSSADAVFLPPEKSAFSFRVAVDSPEKVKIEYSGSWIHLVGKSAAGKESQFSWEADANPGGAMREADIKISLAEGGLPDVFHVRQEGAGLSVSVTYSSQTVKAPAIFGAFREYGILVWGDGTSQSYTEGATHRYPSSGKNTVTFRSSRMQYIDWAEVSEFENGMTIDFSNIRGK